MLTAYFHLTKTPLWISKKRKFPKVQLNLYCTRLAGISINTAVFFTIKQELQKEGNSLIQIQNSKNPEFYKPSPS